MSSKLNDPSKSTKRISEELDREFGHLGLDYEDQDDLGELSGSAASDTAFTQIQDETENTLTNEDEQASPLGSQGENSAQAQEVVETSAELDFANQSSKEALLGSEELTQTSVMSEDLDPAYSENNQTPSKQAASNDTSDKFLNSVISGQAAGDVTAHTGLSMSAITPESSAGPSVVPIEKTSESPEDPQAHAVPEQDTVEQQTEEQHGLIGTPEQSVEPEFDSGTSGIFAAEGSADNTPAEEMIREPNPSETNVFVNVGTVDSTQDSEVDDVDVPESSAAQTDDSQSPDTDSSSTEKATDYTDYYIPESTQQHSITSITDSDGGASTISESVSNGTDVGITASASDADASDSVTYSLSDDAGGRFAIDSNTGVVTVADASLLDYESATSHTIEVTATSSD
ncbi:MAG: cadherin repeat domain-containing protein, partial [Thiotrichales bacterium]|nr:cadherin repeat domain-containing protein [Thiotrichales bacterium]